MWSADFDLRRVRTPKETNDDQAGQLVEMFEQSISGLIKSLRAVKNDPAGEIKVIESAKRDIAVEVASTDRDLKCDAMLKAIYLDMLGHRTLHQHPFQIIELMSSTVPHHKQTGYLAAAQSFTPNTDTLLLAANLLQKDLSTSSGSRTSIAHFHTVLSNLPSLLLLEPLSPGALGLEAPTPGGRSTMISPLLSHSNPGIRRLTILLLHSLKPRTIQIPIPLLKQLLKDEDTSVQSATLSLVTELVLHEDPKEYLDVAPELFAILTTSSNNWILIKVVKAFAPLPAVEPRLLKKLGGPLTNLISNTPATSLLFECIRTCIDCGLIDENNSDVVGASASSTLARTCIDKLGSFLQSGDQNLRYISLVALSKVLRSHSHLVARHHSTILSLIDDPDSTIRLRALDLLGGMANRQNLMDITKRLMAHFFPASNAAERSSSSAIDLLSKQQMSQSEKLVAGSSAKGSGIPLVLSPGYRSSLIGLIVKITSADSYGNITNFHWFIDVLIDLAYLSLSLSNLSSNESGGESVGEKIAAQLVDVTARVKGCRPYAVKKLERLIDDETFLENSAQSNPSSILHGTASEGAEIWEAAVWICGEYCRDSVASPDQTIRSIFRKEVSNLPTKTLTAVAHNGIKLIGKWLEALGNGDQWNEGDAARVREGLSLAVERLEEWKSQGDVELRQRAAEYVALLRLVYQGLDVPNRLQSHPSSETTLYSDLTSTYQQSSFPSDNEPNFFSISTTKEVFGPPKSLLLLGPLFTSHELPPVNVKAQSLIQAPQGLDLDSWWSPDSELLNPSKWEEVEEVGIERDPYGRPLGLPEPVVQEEETRVKKRKKKGKEKSTTAEDDNNEDLQRAAEEDRRREQREERLRRQEDDPYYLGGKKKRSRKPKVGAEADDVESIPVVKLDFNELVAPSAPLMEMEVDVEGELPEGIEVPQPKPPVESRVEAKDALEGELDVGVGVRKKVVKKGKGTRKKKITSSEN